MAEEIQQPETHEVDKTVVEKGTVKFNLQQINNPTPKGWKNISKAARYFLVSLITMISATDLFTGNQSKVINFCLGVTILLLGAIDTFMGVEPSNKDNETNG